MIKVDIISGFLGAGKTTVIKKLLKEVFAGQQVVLIENEFGEIGIDGGFLQEAGIEIREMNSGCICCSLVGDFGEALGDVVEKYSPDRIIIEPSGVGALSDIVTAVKTSAIADQLEINSLTTVVDVKKCKMYSKNFGEFFNDQIASANAIILSRVDLVNEDVMNASLEIIKGINDKAAIVTTCIDDLTGAVLFEAMEGAPSLEEEMLKEHEHHHHHHHDDDDEECCCHHHHDEDEEEHEHHHHHHHDDDDEECCCHHHHDEDEEHEHHHHHHHEGEEHDENCTCGCHDHDHHHHHADDVFTSWGMETAKKFSEDDVEAILLKLENSDEYGSVLRAKGMLQTPEGSWIDFDMVPGEMEIRDGAAQYTGRICVIGADIKEDKIKALFS